jgi:zinc transport system substrate-binding protein
MRLSLRTIIAVGAVTVVSAACRGGASAGDDAIDVVATFYPLAHAAEQVGGDRVRVTNLTPPGAEPHDLELTPDDLEAIATADVVLTLGGGFQSAVEDAVTAEATGTVVTALDAVPEADRIAGDPHAWLDPSLYLEITHAVADAIAAAGADAAEVDRARQTLGEGLQVLDASFEDGLSDCDTRTLLVNHAAFGYLAAGYGLTQAAISGVSPEAEPDPARLAELAELARDEGITTVFTESLVSPEVAETLAAEAGLATAVLNPLEGLTPEQAAAGETYVSVMEENLEVLRDGLGCR